ncbi:hypothetical protein BX070DRAFT_134209 [Coemansia spiralis]|nr:hypothetical protein BX070DRAFT_134209 [Coemansia spiralis]
MCEMTKINCAPPFWLSLFLRLIISFLGGAGNIYQQSCVYRTRKIGLLCCFAFTKKTNKSLSLLLYSSFSIICMSITVKLTTITHSLTFHILGSVFHSENILDFNLIHSV